jgi:hypothetical protein
MGRKRLGKFPGEIKMLAARTDAEDFWKFEQKLTTERRTVQDALNAFLKSYIAGTVIFSGSVLVGSQTPNTGV